jgi:glycosyltransferase involved in cell wall biosynthesis
MVQVSICIPTYNGAQHLSECLDAVLSQSFSNYQVIIVDDQSSDNTWEILNQYAAQDNRISLFRNERNLGLVDNWNRCIELSQGDWIKFVFQDDIIRHDCLERMLKTADVDMPFVLCRRDFFFHSNIDAKTKKGLMSIPRFDEIFPGVDLISPSQICQAVLTDSRNFFGEPTSTLIHRSVFERFGLFNSVMVQLCDLEYWIRVGINTGIKYIPDPLVQFRVHSSSASSKNSKDSQVYRSSHLDRLILLHEFAYNPFYEPLRKFAKQSNLNLNFKIQLAKRAYWLKNIAYSKSPDSSNEMPLINHWQTVAKVYPKLVSSIYLIPYKIESWLRRNLFWRFNNNA